MKQSRPKWPEVSARSGEFRALWGQWSRLTVINNLLYRKWEDNIGKEGVWQFVVPRSKQAEVVFHHHNNVTAGHMGVNKTLKKIQQKFYWVGMKHHVQKYCRECDLCTARKTTVHPQKFH